MEIETAGKKKLPEPSNVEIREQLGQPASFTITYTEDVCDGDFQLLKDIAFNPLKDISIAVSIDDKKYYLIKGVVLGHQITIEHGGEGSQLKITGSDNLVKLGWETKTTSWKNEKWHKTLSESNIQTIFKNKQHNFQNFSILENAEKLEPGIEKKSTPPIANDQESDVTFKERVVQREDDLSFLRRLANQSGMYVWVSYDNDDGKEIAHFDKLPFNEITSRFSLSESNNNINELSINWDADRPTSVESEEINHRTKKKENSGVPAPTQNPLGDMTLKKLTSGVISTFISGQPGHFGKKTSRNEAALNEADWFIKASCSTTYDRLCNIVHAHTIAEIKGAGSRYDGKYVVSGVTHSIDSASYKFQIELQRNAWNGSPEEIEEANKKQPENEK